MDSNPDAFLTLDPEPSLWARFRRSWRYRGWRRTARVAAGLLRYHVRWGWRAPRPHAFDLEFGTYTMSEESARQHAPDSPAGNPHEPIDPVVFDDMLRALKIDYAAFTFMDFGSGQGRALMLAAGYPFRRIVGIENGEEHYRMARRNLAHFQHSGQRCFAIENHLGDALTWPLPLEPTVLYFCEPFPLPVARQMAQRVAQSLRRHPRPAWVLYEGYRCPQAWEETGDFETVWRTYWTRIYRLRPQ